MTETESDDSDGPGFGVVIAVIAVLGVALLASRR
jgi:PGF-CTERM protein